jgi:hypothetical protein
MGLENIFMSYRETISEIRGNNCPHFPSCSIYSELAFKNLGPINGLFLTTDRLMRCGHELELYSQLEINGSIKFLDFEALGVTDTINKIKNEEQFIYRDFKHKSLTDLDFFYYLVDEKLYDEAILEYKRIKFFNKELKDFSFDYNYIRSQFAIGNYEYLIFFIKGSAFENHELFKIKLSESYLKLGNLDLALNSLNGFNSDKKQELLSRIYLLMNEYDLSENSLNLISEKYIFYDYVENNRRLISELKEVKYKSRTVAGFLSLIPGGGYFYSGQKSTALTSLLLNSAFAYATITSINSKNYGVAGLTAVFGGAFYIGNILGGVKSVDRYNTYKKNQYLEKMKYSYNN